MTDDIHISYFRHEDDRLDAWREKYGAPKQEYGMYMKVRPQNARKFRRWMMTNCPLAKCKIYSQYRGKVFSYDIHITDEAEAALFVLRWL